MYNQEYADAGDELNSVVWNGVMWNHLIYPEHSPMGAGDESLVLNWISEEFPDYVVCLSLDGISAADPDLPDTLCKLLPEQQRSFAGFTHGNSLYFCGYTSEDNGDVHDAVENLRSTISSYLGITCTAGLAFLKDKSLKGLSWAAQRAVVSQRRKLREGSGKTFVFDESYIPAAFSFKLYRGIEEQLHNMIHSGDTAELESFLQEAAGLLFTEQYLALNHLRPILQTQIILLSQELVNIGGNAEDMYEKTESILAQMASTYDYSVIKSIFEDAVRWFVHKSADLCRQHATRIVLIAEELIKAKLNDPDLGLNMIAESVYTNPSYLSRIFKQQKNVGITHYINTRRIQYAKRLLSDRTKSITEIAYEAGFSSLTHFERTFKAIADTTPSQYRQSKNVENM